MSELAGAAIGGRYRMLHRIGSGGMGEVWVAHDHHTERDVAVKIVKPRYQNEGELVVRFHREARALSQVQHENVVVVIDTGTCNDTGVDFIAMELLAGETLRERMDRGRLGVDEACALAAQMLSGLTAAHEAGVVHRDVKPENMIVVDGRLKILDFGLARRFDPGDTMTVPGTFMGTPGYAAPEVTLGDGGRDPRSDLYAVGVIWWEMLTGRRLFIAPTPVAVLLAHTTDAPERPSRHAPVPVGVDNMVLRLLDKDPRKRPTADGVLAFLAGRAARPPLGGRA